MFRTRPFGGRAAPGGEHYQRRALVQRLVQPRQAEHGECRMAPFGFQENQHALDHLVRHAERLGGAGQRLAARIADDARREFRRQRQGFGEFREEGRLVGREARPFEHGDRAAGAEGFRTRRG